MMNKMMKKIAAALTVATMAIAALTTIASANEIKYVANDIGLNVRQMADASSKRLGGVYRGDAVDVVSVGKDGWAMINFEGKVGYVKADNLSYTKPAPLPVKAGQPSGAATGANNNAAAPKTSYQQYMDTNYAAAAKNESHMTGSYAQVKVDSGYLALRNAPTYDYSNEIEQLKNGDMVEIMGQTSGSYVYVCASSGNFGWVNAGFLF